MNARQKEAFDLLTKGDCFYWRDEEDERAAQTLNMNDTFGWALAFGEYVPDDQLIEVARLFKFYGYCGLVWWVSKQNNDLKSEFTAINRQIEFVEFEEEFRKSSNSSSEWAYKREVYVITGAR